MRPHYSCRHKRIFSEWRQVRPTHKTPIVAAEPADLERSWYSSLALHLRHHMPRTLIAAAFVVLSLYSVVRQYQSYVTTHCEAAASACRSKYNIALQFVYRYQAEMPLTIIESQTSSVSEAVFGARELRLCESLPTLLSPIPPRVIGRIGLKRIVICKELSHLGIACGGLARARDGVIFFNSVLYDGRRVKKAPERCFYHEIFHLLDDAMGCGDFTKYDGRVAFERDTEWEKLNDAGFQYSSQWRTHYSTLEAKAITPGIWTYYSMTSPSEDKAVLFAYLMTDHEKLVACSKRDRMLEQKIHVLKSRLLKCDPSFDENFWRVRALKGCEKGT